MVQHLHDFWRHLLAEKDIHELLRVPDNALAEIKFAEALPPRLAIQVYRDRAVEYEALRTVSQELEAVIYRTSLGEC
jgi:hypothetical protein